METIKCRGEYITKEITSFEFNEVMIKGIYVDSSGLKVDFHSGDSKVVFRAQEEALKNIFIKENDGLLKISSDNNKFDTDEIKIDIYGSDLSKLDLENVYGVIDKDVLSDNGDITLKVASSVTISELRFDNYDILLKDACALRINYLEGDDLDVKMSEASRLFIDSGKGDNIEIKAKEACSVEIKDIEFDEVEATIEEASQLLISGTSSELEAKIYDASRLKAKDLKVENAKVITEGASYSEVSFTESGRLSASQASKIKYYSDSKDIKITQSSIGFVSNGKE